MSVLNRDDLVAHPTWLEHIRFFFDSIDIEHMKRVANMDLASYEGVKSKATQIYFQTHGGKMPPEADRIWPPNRTNTFKNWILDKFPMGASPLDAAALAQVVASAQQLRPNAASLKQAEIDLLKKAFSEIMARDPNDAQSYFAVAGIHWFPEPSFCSHHEPRYNPWHRVYIDRFENALRSVPGCENTKLPYWDISASIPDWFFEPPFDSFSLPVGVDPDYPAGFKTQRFTKAKIEENLVGYKIAETIQEAMNSPVWERFAQFIEAAHDNGHVSIGPSMERPDVAAFEPIFWFFHCNWERMWWAWQKRHSAESLTAFRSTISNPDQSWLDTSPFNDLEPFGVTADQTIDTSPYAYEEAANSLFHAEAVMKSGNVPIDRAFRLGVSPKLSVRVKGIERLRIKGSFVVHLLADGAVVARQAFFQAHSPEKCPNCVKQAKVNVDLIVERGAIQARHLEARLETLERDRIDKWIPLSQVGTPTINVRELLISE